MHAPTLPPALKTGVSVFLVGAMGLLATGCASSTTTSATYPLHVWRYNQAVDPLRDTFTKFQTDHPNAKISFQNHPLDSYELDSLASLASQNGPEVWSIPNDWLADEESRLIPLPDGFFASPSAKDYKSPSEQLKSAYPPGIANALIDNGKAYGLASNVDILRLYYNPSLFSQASNDFQRSLGNSPSESQTRPVQELLSRPPAVWSELLRQIPYITRKNGSGISRSAIALGTADNVPVAYDTLALLIQQNGSEIVSSDHTRALFSTQQQTPSGAIVRPGENALSFLVQFSNPANPAYTWSPSMPQALDAFGQGKVAMVIAYSDFGKQVKAKYPQFNFSVSQVPQVNTTDQAINIIRFSIDGVTKAASNPDLAFQLLYQTSLPKPSANLAQESGTRSPFTANLQDTTQDLVARDILSAKSIYKKNHTQFDADFLQMIRDVSQNGASATGALDIAAQKINDLLVPPLPNPSPSTQH